MLIGSPDPRAGRGVEAVQVLGRRGEPHRREGPRCRLVAALANGCELPVGEPADDVLLVPQVLDHLHGGGQAVRSRGIGEHEVLGPHTCERLGYALSVTPGTIERQGPLLGEDSEHVYRDILGLSEDVLTTLRGDGVLG